MNVSKIFQRLSYKACFIISSNLFEFRLVILVFRDIRHNTPTACCYATRTSGIPLTVLHAIDDR